MTEDICEVIITAPDPEWLANFTRPAAAFPTAGSPICRGSSGVAGLAGAQSP